MSSNPAPLPTEPQKTFGKRLSGRISGLTKTYFLTGLAVIIPLAVTLWIVRGLVNALDGLIAYLPAQWQPQSWLGYDIPGFGLLATLALIFSVGILTHNFIGQRLVGLWERLISHIPIIGSIYGGVKQIADTLFSNNSNAFRQVVLVPFPSDSTLTLAFLTGAARAEMFNHHDQMAHAKEAMISVYVPTTPNPTSGYFVMYPASQVTYVDMKVDEALKYIMSMGTVAPVLTTDVPTVVPTKQRKNNHR